MIDSLLAFKHKADLSSILDDLGLRNSAGSRNGSTNGTARYALLTLHRPSNVDQRDDFPEYSGRIGGVGELAVPLFSQRIQERRKESPNLDSNVSLAPGTVVRQ